ncbi:MAG: hypothetical protein E7070_11405 [Bacteroidales bacterium]|nr:hypothetical protein [Bacteroidales bacterium]
MKKIAFGQPTRYYKIILNNYLIFANLYVFKHTNAKNEGCATVFPNKKICPLSQMGLSLHHLKDTTITHTLKKRQKILP